MSAKPRVSANDVFKSRKSYGEEPAKKKRKFSLKLPVGRVLVGGLLLGSAALYTGLNTYTVGENEAVYAINTLKPSERVAIDRSEGLNLPFVDTALHLPWPLGGRDAAAPWPFGGHAVVPLSGDFSGTIQTPMYSTRIETLSYSVPEESQDAFLLRYGPFAFGTNVLERLVENDDNSFQGIIDAVTADGKQVDGATQALFSDVNNAVAFVLRGRSVEEINAMKDDQVFMNYLTNEVERLLGGLVDIEEFDISTVSRARDVITFTTADGFPVDVLVSYGGGSSLGRSGGTTAIDPKVVQDVLGEYFLMEYRTGQLPAYIRDELVAAIGVPVSGSQQTSEARWASRIDGFTPSGTTSTSRTLIVNLGNAQDLFYRTFFNSGMIAFENDVAADRMDAGDLEGAIEMYEGVVEYSHLFPLNDAAQADVADAMFSLGFLYEDISAMAYTDGAYDASQEFLSRAAGNFAEFVRIAPAAHPQRNAVMQHLYLNYGEFLDSSTIRINPDAQADLESWYGPLPEEAQPTQAPEATPEATPTPDE